MLDCVNLISDSYVLLTSLSSALVCITLSPDWCLTYTQQNLWVIESDWMF